MVQVEPRTIAAMAEGDDVARIVRVLQQSPARSPLYQWMRKHHGKLVQEFEDTRPSWDALAAEFGAMGLKDGSGGTLTAERTRKVWWRVRRDVATADVRRAARSAGPSTPSAVSVLAETPMARPAPAPVSTAPAARDPAPPAFDPTEGADEQPAPRRFGISRIPK